MEGVRQEGEASKEAQMLVERLKQWPQTTALPAPVRAWLLITGIDILEDKKNYPKEPTSLINVTFTAPLYNDGIDSYQVRVRQSSRSMRSSHSCLVTSGQR